MLCEPMISMWYTHCSPPPPPPPPPAPPLLLPHLSDELILKTKAQILCESLCQVNPSLDR